MIFESGGENDTFDFAKGLGEKARRGDVYCVSGDLGSGKTVFAKGFAKGLGVTDTVTSPTFTLINQYEGRLPFYHFDVYRIKSAEETDELGFEEYLFGDGVCLIEWGELVKRILPENSVFVTFSKEYGDKTAELRRIEVT